LIPNDGSILEAMKDLEQNLNFFEVSQRKLGTGSFSKEGSMEKIS